MTYVFDHFVHFTKNPEKLAESLYSLGLNSTEGGRHEAYGTYNILSYFGLNYIELLGIFDKNIAQTPIKEQHSLWTTLIDEKFSDGTSRIAFRTKDIERDAHIFKQKQLTVEGPIPFQRKRPDGSLVSWKLLFIGAKNSQLPLPFFIQWDETDQTRLTDLTNRNAINNHPLGKVELSSVGIAVNNLEPTIKKWADYFQLKKGPTHIDESLNAKAQSLFFPQDTNITFYEPIGAGLVAETLHDSGEKPFLIELYNEEKSTTVTLQNIVYRFKT